MGIFSINSGVSSQFLAALTTLKNCIELCPRAEWNEAHGDYPFSAVVFHALFDCDYHLCDSEEEFKGQKFHSDHAEAFGDYEELGDGKPTRLYDKTFIRDYYDHCSAKVGLTLAKKTLNDLLEPKSDIRRTMTRLERYINSIRHIQHHAAQLGLRLQFITGREMEWISRGTEDSA